MALADWQMRGKKAYLGIGDIALRLPKLGGNLQAVIASAAIGAFAIEMPNPNPSSRAIRSNPLGRCKIAVTNLTTRAPEALLDERRRANGRRLRIVARAPISGVVHAPIGSRPFSKTRSRCPAVA